MKITSKHGYPIVKEKETQAQGIWSQWKDGIIDDRKFVELIQQLGQMGFSGISKDPMVRKGILNALANFNKTRDYAEAAKVIGAFLSMGEYVLEEHFAESSSWYKRAMENYPELRGDLPASEKAWLNPSLKEKIIEYFKEKYPHITATMEEIKDWHRRNFTGAPRKYDWEAHHRRDRERNIREIQK